MYLLRSRLALAFMVLTAFCAVLMLPVTAACTEPHVDFTFDTGTAPSCPPFNVTFRDTSVIPAGTTVTGIVWNFGDGETSTKKNPVHSYGMRGPYTVALKITSSCGAPKIKTKSVNLVCRPPFGNFIVDKDTGNAPLTVHITDTIQDYCPGSTLVIYENNGEEFSRERNPEITFRSAGTYTIVMSVQKTCTGVPSIASHTITVNPALTVYSAMNFSGPNVTSPTTTVTTTVTPTVTTTTVWPDPVVPVYVDTPAEVFVPVTTAPTTAQAASATQQAGTAGPTPAPSQAMATSAPAAPGTGTLSVITNPAGAQVFVDDVMRGLSPANIPGLPAGPHTLRLEKSGYRNMTVPVSIESGKTTDYSTGLEAESGGMGIVPIIAGVLVIAAVGGGVYWFTRKKSPGTPEQK